MSFDLNALRAAVAREVAAEAEAAGQMSLGALIAALKLLPPDKPVRFDVLAEGGPAYPHSYRGYYDQLALEASEGPCTVGEALKAAEGARGATFEGYKGGEYQMVSTTAVWFASYGMCGRRIVGVEHAPDAVVILTAEDD